MESGTSMAEHPDSFDELVVGLQTTGEQVDESRQLVVLLSSLPSEYDLMSSIVENTKDITLIEVKEKLLKKSEKLQRKAATEKAFRGNANARRFKDGRDNGRKGGPPRNNDEYKSKCFNCDQFGHRKRNCPASKRSDSDDTVFADGERKSSRWLVDSGATSHMTPHRKGLSDYKCLEASIEVTIAEGKISLVREADTVKLTGLDGKGIRMVDVLHIPGLGRR
ncbi:polyprotein [Plasmopara halstedii]|uniref:Polyprotein n=1 Tax=Plasmopara halstedii TaxID=4781 RepID=A0A0P1AI35_PLAHL|nr:polyprotein [Plasmopara halstedii]CEG40154.1 polyprotein [Plasmopara halstedii]|eukprot:XP_024576523.1 polyprotein [Plasmopara halstedii]